jgi:NADP-dependent 3-hydroxy acid dehydrogenase YdfG
VSLQALPRIRRSRTTLAMAILAGLATIAPLPAQETDDLPAVLITGTSTGIGLRMTEVLSQNGFFVYAGARKPADLERLDGMENVKSIRLDVTIQSEIDAAAEFVRAEGRGSTG